MATPSNSSTADREITSTRLVDAPRELVYRVWTDPNHVVKWWGPNGFTNTIEEMKVEKGGMWRFIMHGPDGKDYPNRVTYVEVAAPVRLVYTHGSDIDNDPNGFYVTVTFEEEGDKTRITMTLLFSSVEYKEKAVRERGGEQGQKQTMDKMESYIEDLQFGDDTLTIVREYDAPRELVYEVWSKAEHLAKWWGPAGFEINVAKFDFVPGGEFLYSMSANGAEMWGKFIYREMVVPEKIVFINAFADKDGNTIRTNMLPNWPLEVLNKATFTEHNGKTTVTLKGHPINANEEEMKAYRGLHANMQQGFKGTFDQLDAYLAKLSK